MWLEDRSDTTGELFQFSPPLFLPQSPPLSLSITSSLLTSAAAVVSVPVCLSFPVCSVHSCLLSNSVRCRLCASVWICPQVSQFVTFCLLISVCLFVSCSKFSRWREWNTKINLQHSQNTVRIFPSINRDIWWKTLWYLMIFYELTVKAAFACFVILNLRLNRNTVKLFLISKRSIILLFCASSFTILL